MNTKAVIGCGFGDEGKGKVVSYLCSQSPNSLVIRFCGGHQAGHHVVLRNGVEHVFSNFGSGTLQGCDTYWSKFCTVDPVGILVELDILKRLTIPGAPILYIHSHSPVTTPFEKEENKYIEQVNRHGSCGVGVGQTLQREEDFFSIHFMDLYYPKVLETKLALLEKYYHRHLDIDSFLEVCSELIHKPNIQVWHDSQFRKYDSIVYEGSQGLLLDQHIGFFPHVTRANTGVQNIQSIFYEHPDVFVVTRAYQTRHGNGPMTNEGLSHFIRDNPHERNHDHTFQGKFRKSALDLDLLRYALNREHRIIYSANKTLVITCLDLLDEYILTVDGKVKKFNSEEEFVKTIASNLGFKEYVLSRNPFPEIE